MADPLGLEWRRDSVPGAVVFGSKMPYHFLERRLSEYCAEIGLLQVSAQAEQGQTLYHGEWSLYECITAASLQLRAQSYWSLSLPAGRLSLVAPCGRLRIPTIQMPLDGGLHPSIPFDEGNQFRDGQDEN